MADCATRGDVLGLVLLAAVLCASGSACAQESTAAVAARLWRQACAAPLERQIPLLEGAAENGSMEAAALLITWGEDLSGIEPTDPAIFAWLARGDLAQGMTGAQIYGDVLATSVFGDDERDDEDAGAGLQADGAIALMTSAPIANPHLRLDLAWARRCRQAHARQAEDGGAADAGAADDDQALTQMRAGRSGQAISTQVAWLRILSQRQADTPAGHAAALALMREALTLAHGAGDRWREAQCTQAVAWQLSLQERDGVRVPYDACIWKYEQAASLFAAIDRTSEQDDCLYAAALLALPTTNPAGSWHLAERLAGEMGRRAAAAAIPYDRHLALHLRATCLSRWNDPHGDNQAAADLFAMAAQAAEEIKLSNLAGSELHERARCLVPTVNPLGDWDAVIACEMRAAQLHGEGDDHVAAGESFEAAAFATEPGCSSSGSWAAAAALYGRAALEFMRGPDVSQAAHATERRAWCCEPCRDAACDWRLCAAWHGQAAILFKRAGLRKSAADAIRAQRRCESMAAGGQPAASHREGPGDDRM